MELPDIVDAFILKINSAHFRFSPVCFWVTRRSSSRRGGAQLLASASLPPIPLFLKAKGASTPSEEVFHLPDKREGERERGKERESGSLLFKTQIPTFKAMERERKRDRNKET